MILTRNGYNNRAKIDSKLPKYQITFNIEYSEIKICN